MSNYKENRARVFEIYGIDPKDKKYDCHHICDRASVKQGKFGENFDVHEKSNLYPTLKEDHAEINKRLEALRSGIKHEKHRNNTTSKRKRKKRRRRR